MDFKTNDKIEQLELLRSVAKANNVPVGVIRVDEDGFFTVEYEVGYYTNFEAAVTAIKSRKK
jgi:hypothetical protein